MNLDLMYYISTDHLGSINCVCKKPPTSSLLSHRISVIYASKLTKFVVSKASNLPISYQAQSDFQNNKNGNVVDDLSYDAWGRNRNPINWSYTNITLSSVTDRGYTSHEQLPNFGLINMNGRVYDPMTLGFLSPDPFVQSSNNSQSYNRFNYCFNNPLKYADPSGYIALNPWYEYQNGPKSYYTFVPEDLGDKFKDFNGRDWIKRADNFKDILNLIDKKKKNFFVKFEFLLDYRNSKNLNVDGENVFDKMKEMEEPSSCIETDNYYPGPKIHYIKGLREGAYIPLYGIRVGEKSWMKNDKAWLQHEYGHFLQYLIKGPYYYNYVAFISGSSMVINDYDSHNSQYVELEATTFAYLFFSKQGDFTLKNTPNLFNTKPVSLFQYQINKYKNRQNPLPPILWF